MLPNFKCKLPPLFLLLLIGMATLGDVEPLAAAEVLRPGETSALVYPLVGTRISSKFGMRIHPIARQRRHHKGLDLAAPEDALVRAIQGGRVVFADPYGGYGNLIVVRHPNGLTSHYGHLKSFRVNIGEMVAPGQVIGLVGSTGRVTGPHLHFEVRREGDPLNPLDLFPEIASRGEG